MCELEYANSGAGRTERTVRGWAGRTRLIRGNLVDKERYPCRETVSKAGKARVEIPEASISTGGIDVSRLWDDGGPVLSLAAAVEGDMCEMYMYRIHRHE